MSVQTYVCRGVYRTILIKSLRFYSKSPKYSVDVIESLIWYNFTGVTSGAGTVYPSGALIGCVMDFFLWINRLED